MKKLTFTRSSSIKIKALTKDETDDIFKIHRGKNLDQKKANASSDFFQSATFLTYQQYIDLVHTRPYLSDQLMFYKLSGSKIIEGLIVITSKEITINSFKVLHTYINNRNLIKIYQSIKGDYFFFDQSISFAFADFLGTIKYIKPDAIIIKDGKTIFLESDLGTESFKKLRDKSKSYCEYLSGISDHDTFQLDDIKILFFTTTQKRITHLRQEKVFQGLENLNLIRYGINDTG